jgi:hypothetical protein
VKRAVVKPVLEIERKDEQKPTPGNGARNQRGEGRGKAAVGDDLRIDEWACVTASEPAEVPGRDHSERYARSEGGERPRGPALLAAEQQRQHDQEEGGGAEDDSGQIEPAPLRSSRVGKRAPCAQDQRYAHGHVDQEDWTPGEPQEIAAHQQAAEGLPGNDAHGEHHRKQGQRPGALGALISQLDDRRDLRGHHRARRALDDAGGDQSRPVWGDTAHERRRRKPTQAYDEHAAMAVVITEPRTRDQEHRVCQRVAGQRQHERHAREIQVGLDLRAGDVRDRCVERRHERPPEEDRKDDPSRPRRRVGLVAGMHGFGCLCGGHAPDRAPVAPRRPLPTW